MSEIERRYDIDWIRIIAFFILIFYHVGLVFTPWHFHINNKVSSPDLESFLLLINPWRLPLLFFISGVGVRFAFKKRSSLKFLKERSIRLLLPLIFGILVIIPPQTYFERLAMGENFSSFLEFYPSIFTTGVYPKGNFTYNHLWFVLYLYIYCLFALPLFLFLNRNQERIEQALIWLCTKNRIYLVSLIIFISELILRPHFEDTKNVTNDWANHSFYFLFFISGYIYSYKLILWKYLKENVWKSLILAIFSIFLFIILRFLFVYYSFDESTGVILYYSSRPFIAWLWILAIIALADRYLNKSSALLSYLNRGVYPFYILHQTVLIASAYYIVQLEIHFALKLVILIILTAFGSLVPYEYLIKKGKILRLLFGLKNK